MGFFLEFLGGTAVDEVNHLVHVDTVDEKFQKLAEERGMPLDKRGVAAHWLVRGPVGLLAVLGAVGGAVALAALQEFCIGAVAVAATHSNMEEFLSAKALFASIHKKENREVEIDSYQAVPLQLVRVDDQGNLEMCEAGERMLNQISECVTVIGAFGPAKSGKSSLLNLLIRNSGEGFSLNHDSPRSKTEGIWIWGEPVKTKENLIIFLDCQGLKPIEERTSTDAKIISLLFVMCSVLIYNSKGVIDELSIRELASATCFGNIIDYQFGYKETPEEIRGRMQSEAPKFIWALRDFHLSIVNDQGVPVTSKEYMENVLSMPTFMGKNGKINSEFSEMVLTTFKDRDCVTLPRPVEREKDLESFDEFSLPDLRIKFQKAFEKFKLDLLEFCPNKRFGDDLVTGFQLSALVTQLVSVLNQGEIPSFYLSWDYAVRAHYEEVLCRAKERYLEARDVDPSLMPYEEKELLEKLQSGKDQGLVVLSQISSKNPDLEIETIEEYFEFFQEDLKNLLSSNIQASEAYNLSVIEQLYRPLINKIDDGYYSERFEEMETEWIKIMRQYERVARGPGKFLAMSEFCRKHQHDAFAKFFQEIMDKHKHVYDDLKDEESKDKAELIERERNEARQKIIDEHVKCI